MTHVTEVSKDQYSDGVAAKIWELYIGNREDRTVLYREWLVNLLCKHQCNHVIDVASGTGIDSVMLLEEGFRVTSCDGSDKMVMQAYKERWDRRREQGFDDWEIELANWLTVDQDIDAPQGGFDALICLGNSFAHLPDFDRLQSSHKKAMKNFANLLKPGGVMIIDHRNYDAILDTGRAPKHNIYYNSNCIEDITTSVKYVDGKPGEVQLDYHIDTAMAKMEHKRRQSVMTTNINGSYTQGKVYKDHLAHIEEGVYKFSLTYYPHRLNAFTGLINECFGDNITHTVYGDYKPQGEIETPAYFIHVIEKHL